MNNFSWALTQIEKGTFVKRKRTKNDTVIIKYKNRLYHMCLSTGVRYPYSPTNADIFIKDWCKV